MPIARPFHAEVDTFECLGLGLGLLAFAIVQFDKTE